MKRDVIYERVLRRLLCEETPDLGDVEFSTKRRDGAPTNEPDTPDEAKLYDRLKRWVDSGKNQYIIGVAPIISDLMKDPKYGKFFHAPSSSAVLHRGLRKVSFEDMSRWSGDVDSVIAQMRNEPQGETDCDITYRSRSEACSWTYSELTADEFAAWDYFTLGAEDNEYKVVLTAQVGDNPEVFFDLNAVQDAVPSLHFKKDGEGEVISMAPVRVTSIRWKRRDLE